jgi:tRNA 2-thiocytidine biosynthesis protein TtcA
VSNAAKRTFKHLCKQVSTTVTKYNLLAPGDRVGVAMSGGKDSYSMLVLLQQVVRSLELDVHLTALHLDQGQPGYDGAPLRNWLQERGVAHQILREDTYSVVLEHTKPGNTYCSVCSRLRRGALYTALDRLGLNKLALGHHRDDALETLLLNLFYAGKLQAMPASYRTDDDRFDVIRPLIECAEEDLIELAQVQQFPILPCNLCGSQEGLKRQKIKAMLTDLERENPHVRSVMLNAIGNVRPTHLLDRDVLAAWQSRDPEIRPDPEPRATVQHMAALPFATSPLSTLAVSADVVSSLPSTTRRLPLITG